MRKPKAFFATELDSGKGKQLFICQLIKASEVDFLYENHLDYPPFRVIGPVSKDAVWVKEGHKFGRYELGFKIKDDLINGSKTDFYVKFANNKDNLEAGISLCEKKVWVVGVMCSNCKTFH